MTIKFLDEVKEVDNDVGNGWFGYKSATSYVHWEHCRDRVQIIGKSLLEENGLYFRHRNKRGNNVIAFLHRIETMLKIKDKSVYARTNIPNTLLWIKLSSFWLHNMVRRSFLTFALRCGSNYKPDDGDNFWECFEKNKYGKTTMPAVRVFLTGHTLFKGTALHMFQGWFNLFNHKNEEQVKILLKKYSRSRSN